nr:immunoglobulin heavy chain junction region [Macaca mulatta]
CARDQATVAAPPYWYGMDPW